jgi:Transposase Tn5 dimerisation domain/Transposase DNA-binding
MAKDHQEENWIEKEFGGVRLGDVRKEKRLKKVARDMDACMGGSLLEASGNWAGAKGAYRLFDTPMDPQALLVAHVEQTIKRMEQKPVVLAVQDTTTLNHTSHGATEGLGLIGNNQSGNRGFFCHSTLAMDEEGTGLGLLRAETYVRAANAIKRKRGPQAMERESRRWLNSLDACQYAAGKLPGTRIVNIGDREADFYEFTTYAAGHAPDVSFLVRAEYDRKMGGEGLPTLFEEVGAKQSRGTLAVEVPRRTGKSARTASLEIRFCGVKLQAPAHWNPEYKKSPAQALWIIEAREKRGTGDGQPLLWRLLTNMRIEGFAQAVEKVKWYCKRWRIEVFHKVIKSGCRVESRQLESRERLERVLMVDLVMAWRVLHLMGTGRSAPQVSAEEILSQSQWKALWCFEKKKKQAPQEPPSMGEAMLWVAKLGGFPARKGDGNPGPEVLWRGLKRLDDITAAYLVFNPPTCG